MNPLQKINLRRIEREDIPLLWQWSRNEELSFFNAFSTNKSRAEFEREYESNLGDNTIKDFLILLEEKEMPIGFCGIKEINWIDRHGEIFISVCDEKARKKGIAILALLLLSKIAFAELNLNKIYSKVASHNERTLNLIKDWGFVHEGTLREMHFYHNSYYDIHIYGLLRKEINDLLGTAIEKISKHLYPSCTDETIKQIIANVNLIAGIESSSGKAYAVTSS